MTTNTASQEAIVEFFAQMQHFYSDLDLRPAHISSDGLHITRAEVSLNAFTFDDNGEIILDGDDRAVVIEHSLGVTPQMNSALTDLVEAVLPEEEYPHMAGVHLTLTWGTWKLWFDDVRQPDQPLFRDIGKRVATRLAELRK